MEISTENPKSTYSAAERAKQARENILFAFAVAIALFLAYQMREILLMLYASALFAVVLIPVIRGIMRVRIGKRHAGRGLAILLLFIGVAGAAALFFSFAVPPIVSELGNLAKEMPIRGPQILGRLRQIPFASDFEIPTLVARLQGFASNFVGYFFLSISGWAGKIADVATVIVLTAYFMLEGDAAYRWSLSLFPSEIRERLDGALMRAGARMGKWLLGQGLLMLILGVLSTITFILLHIRYAYMLGVVMGILNIVPIVGGLASMVLVVLVAAIDSWNKVLGALLFYVIYAQIETSYLTPRIMQNSVNLAGLAVLVALLVGSKVAGVVGATVAVPTAVLVAVLIEEYLVQQDAPRQLP